jgi:hypothetical protein
VHYISSDLFDVNLVDWLKTMVSSQNSDDYDVITSIAIPLALAASSMLMIVSFDFRLCDTNKIMLRVWAGYPLWIFP